MMRWWLLLICVVGCCLGIKSMSDTEAWEKRLRAKLDCLNKKKSAFYFYHQRKAAGTTVRELLRQSATAMSVPFFETEGISMHSDFSSRYIHSSDKADDSMSLLSVISLRNPVDRIVSLYWYEHVAWFDEVLRQPAKIKPFHVWVDGWRDGSAFKEDYMKRSPGSVYVEIENCYIKSLIGWMGGPIDYELALEQAKALVAGFDILVLSEWLSDDDQKKYLASLLGDRIVMSSDVKLVSSDKNARKRLHSQLMMKEAATMVTLRELNKYDLELYEYARMLLQSRIEYVKLTPYHAPLLFMRGDMDFSNQCMTEPPPFTKAAYNFKLRNPKLERVNLVRDSALPDEFRRQIGLFQHPGHKGPT
jgi:hypothetical protein